MTQCILWKNIDRPPRGLPLSVSVKVNVKLGGTNHTLASRLPSAVSNTFQDPPVSLSWIFDTPCMMIGVDVSHPDKSAGPGRSSIAAVVGSMDGCLSQYAAHLSEQNEGVEMVAALEESVFQLLTCFKQRNHGQFPETIFVYRDGVAEGQFQKVLDEELPRIRNAVHLHGYEAKIVIMVCQKRHKTRLVYEEGEGQGYINPCPGLVVDARGGNQSITSATWNEFYLNSHKAIQGTAKACKYTLLHDELGLKLSELELLTYWITYLYARCNKSVSYPPPAYYAHWASKRGKELVAAGARNEKLAEISELWMRSGIPSSMFFI